MYQSMLSTQIAESLKWNKDYARDQKFIYTRTGFVSGCMYKNASLLCLQRKIHQWDQEI